MQMGCGCRWDAVADSGADGDAEEAVEEEDKGVEGQDSPYAGPLPASGVGADPSGGVWVHCLGIGLVKR